MRHANSAPKRKRRLRCLRREAKLDLSQRTQARSAEDLNSEMQSRQRNVRRALPQFLARLSRQAACESTDDRHSIRKAAHGACFFAGSYFDCEIFSTFGRAVGVDPMVLCSSHRLALGLMGQAGWPMAEDNSQDLLMVKLNL